MSMIPIAKNTGPFQSISGKCPFYKYTSIHDSYNYVKRIFFTQRT